MIAATYTQGGAFRVMDVPVPEISEGEALLRVEATSICGTDMKILRAGHRKLTDGQRVVLGHEFAGVIEKSRAPNLPEGSRVGVAPNWGCGHCDACIRGMANYCADFSAFGINHDGSHAEYVRITAPAISQGNIVPLPQDTPWEITSLAEPLSCVVNAQKSLPVRAGDTVAVYGCGPMGLLHILLVAATGAREIIAIDTNEERLASAREAGATQLISGQRENVRERVKEITSGRGLDAAITAAPVPEIVQEALQLLAPFGRLCLFAGLPKDKPEVALDGNAIHYKNLYVTGTTGGCNDDYRLALKLIHSGRVPVAKVISHRFPISDLSEAYDTALSGKAMKVVILANV
ncbi:MAG: alcohol dehydrogenase catalytic domain-containing protein [Terrimicrobiaceae bacterium]|nr:alcohol dehydrogenase catalytic domain-containing protein [Terrimicrobiaceae bacterium]